MAQFLDEEAVLGSVLNTNYEESSLESHSTVESEPDVSPIRMLSNTRRNAKGSKRKLTYSDESDECESDSEKSYLENKLQMNQLRIIT